MSVMITAEIEDQSFTVDLSRVTGLDALAYRHQTGSELDALVLGWVEAGKPPVLLADLAVVKWLWARQNGYPTVTLAEVASGVTLLPQPEPLSVAEADAESIAAIKAVQSAASDVAKAYLDVADAEAAVDAARAAKVAADAALAAARGDDEPPAPVGAEPAPVPVAPAGGAEAEVG